MPPPPPLSSSPPTAHANSHAFSSVPNVRGAFAQGRQAVAECSCAKQIPPVVLRTCALPLAPEKEKDRLHFARDPKRNQRGIVIGGGWQWDRGAGTGTKHKVACFPKTSFSRAGHGEASRGRHRHHADLSRTRMAIPRGGGVVSTFILVVIRRVRVLVSWGNTRVWCVCV